MAELLQNHLGASQSQKTGRALHGSVGRGRIG